MECFRIDESGYTGFDLLNSEQRFQGAAAVAISDEDAERLIKEHFPRLQAAELKYRALSRRPGNHPRLLALLRDVLRDYRCVTYVCDKRFLLILMFLDYGVEPYYYERGFDFYQDGQNYGLASLLAVAGPTLLGREEFDAMLAAFQRATKDKTPESLRELVAAVRRTRWGKLPEALGPLAQYAAPECLSAIATPGVSTDAAMVVLQSLISRMEQMSAGPYRVEHDQSKNLATYHGLLQRFIDHTGEIELRQSEIASFKFPLKLTRVTQVDSKASPAVQIADVMIGAVLEASNIMTGVRVGGLDPEALFPLFSDDHRKEEGRPGEARLPWSWGRSRASRTLRRRDREPSVEDEREAEGMGVGPGGRRPDRDRQARVGTRDQPAAERATRPPVRLEGDRVGSTRGPDCVRAPWQAAVPAWGRDAGSPCRDLQGAPRVLGH